MANGAGQAVLDRPGAGRTDAASPRPGAAGGGSAPAAALLEVEGLVCRYDQIPVLHGVSLRVMPGELVAMVGANGAGKSTLLRTIAGLMTPVAGTIRFAGESIGGEPAHRVLPRGISYVPEGRRLFPKLTVRENLELGAYACPDRQAVEQRLAAMMELFPILRERADQTAETMSGGEQQMCAIARGLMSAPRLLLIDELSLGLMPAMVEKVLAAVVAVRQAGTTVVLVEQMVQEALEIADRGYVLQVGRVVAEGAARDLLAAPEVRRAYLGL
ncbi:MAG: Branched-chain amino acid transport ATP-binding protein LivF [Candidatus Ozemobacter sibiricus]|uniref:Branched-chain amino acid transport ATP-binding protein LivF n=1 Tax=Candidatus Ozemobacter sibiricus TaxID=2268124 RepID=A0A367ZTR7_9BACT|nr:MAG: Branched-chain amino acid transport ATP-binding protein LivF [Candidatus Ozemobacter sibiricus]